MGLAELFIIALLAWGIEQVDTVINPKVWVCVTAEYVEVCEWQPKEKDE